MGAIITSGYTTWIHEPQRARSGELNFGAWWKMEGARWRVSWIEDTGEFYAAELGTADRFIVIGHFDTKKDANNMMRHWFEGNNLRALIHKVES